VIWAEVWAEVPDDRSELVAEIFRDAGAGGIAFTGPLLMRRSAEAANIDGKLFPEDIPGSELIRVTAYYPADDMLENRLLAIRSALDAAFSNDRAAGAGAGAGADAGAGPDAGGADGVRPAISVTRVAGEDWASAWKQHYHIDHVGRRIVIVPSWIEYAPELGEAVVLLDPGEAFGTGQHESTRGCLMALEESVRPGASVLDVGCGSGILSIAAARLGARSVVGIDIDTVAVNAARNNVEANNVADCVAIRQGDLAGSVGEEFDVVVANILADVVIELMPELPRVLAPGGHFVCSGFVDKHAARVEQALRSAGYCTIRHIQVEDWVTLVSVAESF